MDIIFQQIQLIEHAINVTQNVLLVLMMLVLHVYLVIIFIMVNVSDLAHLVITEIQQQDIVNNVHLKDVVPVLGLTHALNAMILLSYIMDTVLLHVKLCIMVMKEDVDLVIPHAINAKDRQ